MKKLGDRVSLNLFLKEADMAIETIGITSSQLIASPDVPNSKNSQIEVKTSSQHAEHAEKIREDVRRVVDELAKVARSFNRRLEFSINDDTKEVIVKVVDQDSGEVVKQIPAEEIVRLHARIREAIGLLFDEKI